jgi:uncharacterized membrane protein YeaQ/YmgE (transglycosylase-associated protein family)
MSLFHIIVWIVVGLIAGALARLIMPGRDPMGILMTIVLGIIGSFVGGFIANLIFHFGNRDTLHAGGLIMSVVGAIIVLWVWRMIKARTA